MPNALQQLHIGVLSKLQKPALVPYDGTRPVLVAHSAATHQSAADLLEAIALQLLTQQPTGNARVMLYEPSPSPQFSQLKRIFAQTERRVGEQLLSLDAYTRHLRALTDLAHRRFALLAGMQVDDIAAYNQKATQPEKLEYLLVSAVHGPSGFEQDLQPLLSLCLQGPRVGIVPLLLRGPTELEEDKIAHNRKPLQSFWQTVAPQSFGFDWRGASPQPVNQLTELWRLFNKFGVNVGMPGETVRNTANALVQAATQAKQASPHTDFLSIPIGQDGAQTAHFSMGEASNVYHAMMGGGTRSGKSTLVNNFILQTCETQRPNQIQLWLIDFAGVGFNIYGGLGHVAALYLKQTDPAPLMAAYNSFDALFDQRRALFQQSDPPAERIEDYNRIATTSLPRCLMIVDEAHNIYEDKETKATGSRLVSRTAKEGAKFGLHLIFITQGFQDSDMKSDVKGQFHLRIGLQMATDQACRALMGGDNLGPRHLPRYAAVYNSERGDAQHNRIVQLHHLSRADLLLRLGTLKAKYPAQQNWPIGLAQVVPQPAPPLAAKPRGAGEWADWDTLL